MFNRTYSDGSSTTTKDFVVALGIAALASAAVVVAIEKYERRKEIRIMKKYGWPEEAFNK